MLCPIRPLPMIIRASDSEASELFQQAYEEYKDAIFRHCYFHVFDREKALDLVQEAYIKTWEYISEGNDIDNVRAFLYKVATNLYLNDFRKKKETSLDQLQEAGYDPPTEDAELSRDFLGEAKVMKTLEKIEEPYRTAVALRYIEDLSPAEIAEITGESANTISVRVTRGVKQLRTLLDTHEFA